MIKIDVNVFFGSVADEKILSKIAEILTAVNLLGNTMANELETLQASVTASGDATDSAVILLTGLKAALDAAIASGNPAALQALSDSLGTNTAELAAAILANTPAIPVV